MKKLQRPASIAQRVWDGLNDAGKFYLAQTDENGARLVRG